MFDKIKDMGKLMKQASEMKSKMKAIQDELKNERVLGESENGKVKITLTGEMDVHAVSIDPSLSSDPKRLEKAIQTAVNHAIKKAKDIATKKLSGISSGLDLPGF